MNEQVKEEIDQELLEYLSGFVTENKMSLFNKILPYRTRHLTVVMENIYQSQNASAVIRTCECLGIQDVHVIEVFNKYKLNKGVARGAGKWVDLHRHHNTRETMQLLKQQGYTLVATSPGESSIDLYDLPLDNKIGLLFGTELTGLSEEALEEADLTIKIPMFGFTESYNLSVSASICLSHMIRQLHTSDIPWQLSAEERKELQMDWVKKVIRRADKLETEYYIKKRAGLI
ncbi:RNA methyltransferase [Rapidithrix thailandica]|uniref:tRNA (guanosine(18)-2'-O)-methyltransferase n=1 Tax=Rapidithrix thailandica TaxID=413964 RepID=A0AAW9S1Z0_9BACT